jgi:hypothetical protein
MLYVGLDLSRKRLDWHALALGGERVGEGACPPDRDGLAHLVHGLVVDLTQNSCARCSCAVRRSARPDECGGAPRCTSS